MSFTEVRVDALEIINALCGSCASAEAQLSELLKAGGFIAGGAARAGVAWLHDRSLNINDQYDDIDVYFEHTATADATLEKLLSDSEWVAHAGYAEVAPENQSAAGSHKRWFSAARDASVKYEAIAGQLPFWDQSAGAEDPAVSLARHKMSSLTVTSSSKRDSVCVNVVSFKRGAAEEILRTFDIVNVQCALLSDRVIIADEFVDLERSASVKLMREELRARAASGHVHKSLSRFGKYVQRMRDLRGIVRAEEDVIEFFLSIMSSDDLAALSQSLTQTAMHQLSTVTPFVDRLRLAMMLWPRDFIKRWQLLALPNPYVKVRHNP